MAVVKSLPVFRGGMGAVSASRLRLCMVSAVMLAGGLAAADAVNKAFRQSSDRQNEARAVAYALSVRIDRDVAAAEARLSTLASSPALQAENMALFRDQLLATFQPEGRWFLVYDEQGKVLFETPRPAGVGSSDNGGAYLEPQNVMQAFLREAPARRVESLRATGSDKLDAAAVHVSAVTSSGRRYGLVEAISGPSLRGMLSISEIPADGTVGFAAVGGRILFSLPPSSEAYIAAPLDRSGVNVTGSSSGRRSILAFHRSDMTDWIFYVRYSERSPFITAACFAFFILIGATLFGLLANWALRRLITGDIKPVRALEQALQYAVFRRDDSENRLAMFREQLADGVFIVDYVSAGNLTLHDTNPAFWRIFEPCAKTGQSAWSDLAPSAAALLRSEIIRVIKSGDTAPFQRTIGCGAEARECEIRLGVSLSPQGTFWRVFGTVRDVTQAQRQYNALKESLARFREARDIAGITPWKWSFGDETLEWVRQDDGNEHSLPRPEQPSWAIHPADLHEIQARLPAALQGMAPVHLEFRAIEPGHPDRYFIGRGGPYVQDGVGGMAGILLDVTEQRNAEAARDRALSLLQRIVETSFSILYIRDLHDGGMVYLNGQTEAVTGYDVETLTGLGCSGLRTFIHPDDVVHFEEKMDRSAELSDGKSLSVDFRILHRDGGWRWLQATETVFSRDASGRPLQILGSVQDVTEAHRSKQRLTEVSGQMLMMQDRERRRIARELHDSTSQLLAGATMIMAKIRSQVTASNSGADEDLCRVNDLIQQSHREIRTISYLLHPPLLDEVGLKAALEWYVGGLSRQTRIRIHLSFPAELQEQRLPKDVEFALFRVVQEALSNATRHAACDDVWISLSLPCEQPADDCSLKLLIRDNGMGIQKSLDMRPGARRSVTEFGVGIFGMSERIRQLNGSLSIRNHEQAGTVVELIVPLPAAGFR